MKQGDKMKIKLRNIKEDCSNYNVNYDSKLQDIIDEYKYDDYFDWIVKNKLVKKPNKSNDSVINGHYIDDQERIKQEDMAKRERSLNEREASLKIEQENLKIEQEKLKIEQEKVEIERNRIEADRRVLNQEIFLQSDLA